MVERRCTLKFWKMAMSDVRTSVKFGCSTFEVRCTSVLWSKFRKLELCQCKFALLHSAWRCIVQHKLLLKSIHILLRSQRKQPKSDVYTGLKVFDRFLSMPQRWKAILQAYSLSHLKHFGTRKAKLEKYPQLKILIIMYITPRLANFNHDLNSTKFVICPFPT